jgi:hypothetical protein
VLWNAILWAKAHGARWFDFGGLDKASADALIAGHSLEPAPAGGNDFFKLRFGGEPYLIRPRSKPPGRDWRCAATTSRAEPKAAER